MANLNLSDVEYLQELNLVSTEIDNVGVIYHSHEELNRLAWKDGAVLDVLNADALFWLMHQHSLQATMFITLGRIFDPDDKNYSIHRLVHATLGNLHVFSRDALERRKLKLSPGHRPDWLDERLDEAWYPNDAGELRYLKKALAPHKTRFDEIYRPIRHNIAHRIMTEDEAGQKYFCKTNRKEVAELIDFLRDLTAGLTDFYWNGHKPELGKRDFTNANEKIRKGVQSVIQKLLRGEKLPETGPLTTAA